MIDDNCSIGYGAMVSAKNRIHLERDVLVGQQVVIIDHNHAYEDIMTPIAKQGLTEGGRIRIGQGTWIGRGSAIICARGELTIGRNCVVSVHSMITRSIPDYSVVFGSPATIIRQYDLETRAWRMGPKRNGDKQIPEALSVPIGEVIPRCPRRRKLVRMTALRSVLPIAPLVGGGESIRAMFQKA